MTDQAKGLRIMAAVALLGATFGAGAALSDAARMEAQFGVDAASITAP